MQTPFHLALFNKLSIRKLELFVKYGADIALSMPNGYTSLQIACMSYHPQNFDILHFLLENGAQNMINECNGKIIYLNMDLLCAFCVQIKVLLTVMNCYLTMVLI